MKRGRTLEVLWHRDRAADGLPSLVGYCAQCNFATLMCSSYSELSEALKAHAKESHSFIGEGGDS